MSDGVQVVLRLVELLVQRHHGVREVRGHVFVRSSHALARGKVLLESGLRKFTSQTSSSRDRPQLLQEYSDVLVPGQVPVVAGVLGQRSTCSCSKREEEAIPAGRKNYYYIVFKWMGVDEQLRLNRCCGNGFSGGRE